MLLVNHCLPISSSKVLHKLLNTEKSTAWFKSTHLVLVKYGFNAKQEMPCTFGMNEKAGMNAVELDKYSANSILPLFTDLENVPGKRILLKVNSDPGRSNLEMLANLLLRGC
jgi:hypothetical protein